MTVLPQQPGGAERGYRGDIDGLRAVAVIAVVAFHAGIPGIPGGFAGVDIFFVISGYLIGGIVHREIGAGHFAFAAFYARRARRILPALIAVSLATLALGVILLGPGELARFAISAAAALAGVANVWFLHSTDYFAPDARLEPFLMTWSLGIEEQFYVILPPLLLLVRRWRAPALLEVVLIATTGSLALALLATPVRPVEAFYLLPTRAWELGLGVALAIAQDGGFRLSHAAQSRLAALGLAALVATFALIDESARFPGYAALLPTLGTAALIAAPTSAINHRLLASRPAIAIGLVSYSWYLLHWPLLALLRICAAGPVPVWLMATVAFGSIVPAYASWRWIERPFRHATPGWTAGRTLRRYGSALVACIALLIGVALSGGLPIRTGEAGARIEAMIDTSRGGPCLAGYGVDRPNLGPACAPTGDRPTIALLGDSHAAALADALRAYAGPRGVDILQLTAASCPPLLGATLTLHEHPGASRACARFNSAAIARAADDPRVRLVIVTGFWQSPFDPRAIMRNESVVDVDPNGQNRSSSAELRIALTRTLVRLRASGKRVLVLGDTPWLRFDPALHAWTHVLPVRAAIERRITPGLNETGVVDRRFVEPLDDEGGRIVANVASSVPGVRMVGLRDLLCDQRGCRTSGDAMPFFVDPQHLSRAGAAHVVGHLDAAGALLSAASASHQD